MIFLALAFGAVLGPYTFYRLRAGPIRFKVRLGLGLCIKCSGRAP